MRKALCKIRDVFISCALVLILHIAALISLIRLFIEKVFEYFFKALLFVVFVVLLAFNSYKGEYTQSLADIKELWNDLVNLVFDFTYEDLVQWYKNVFLKKNKKKEKIAEG